ncbi:hypothetical protein A2164_02670 [Candidatus Curtissbacteria bacterium RBG_13_35_7]|uniref:EamA domain-containing protein n=1 Tax=Candidatus Curtissbacteria bacterium RBG_13_35_7 TaxID=1797705 RepID=A0A1F5G288_9BACT|nr:MAG: hypothetical protein A2164_02670 [Candidatus Curtissbacteria bacterium RBG_13_35_7]
MINKGIILILTTALISGFSIFINKFIVTGLDPYLFTFLKNIIVAIFLFSIVLVFKEFKIIKRLTKRDWLILSLIGLFGGSVPFLLFFKGLTLTSAASGAFIHKTMFIFVAILARVFLHEKISNRLFIAAFLLILGNLLFLRLLPYKIQFGDLLILLATLFWAIENVISKYALRTLTPRIVAFGRMGIGSIFILLFFAFTGDLSAVAGLTGIHWQWVVISAIILLGYVITWYTGLKYINVSKATMILLLGSPITLLLTFIFQGQIVSLKQLIGSMLIVAGLLVLMSFKNLKDILEDLPKFRYGRA